MNVTGYLEALAGRGISREDLPPLQPLFQHRVWERFEPGEGPERLAAVIGQLSAEDDRFSMGGGSCYGAELARRACEAARPAT